MNLESKTLRYASHNKMINCEKSDIIRETRIDRQHLGLSKGGRRVPRSINQRVLANARVGEGVYTHTLVRNTAYRLLYMNRFGSLVERRTRKSWLTAKRYESGSM